MEENQFDCLTDDIVLVIIDKLCYIETPIRFSLVCKRFASLVPKTHSLTMKLVFRSPSSSSRFGHVGLLFNNLFNKVFGALFPKSNAIMFKEVRVIEKFQEIKHLQFEFQFSKNICPKNKHLQCVGVFGSHLEASWFLYAESDDKVDNETNDDDFDMNYDRILNLMKRLLKHLCLRRQVAQIVIRDHPTLQSFSAFDSRILFSMGEEQVARCRSHICENPLEISGPIKVQLHHLPVLELKCGKIMKKVTTATVSTSDKTDFDELSFPGESGEISNEALVEMRDKLYKNGRLYEIEFPQGITFSN